jgi:hypothetical protein
MIEAFLSVRELGVKSYKAENLATTMRSGMPDDRPGFACYWGLPYRDMLSWDMSNLASFASPDNSIYFADSHPAQWNVRASNSGARTTIEGKVEVFDIEETIRKARKSRKSRKHT